MQSQLWHGRDPPCRKTPLCFSSARGALASVRLSTCQPSLLHLCFAGLCSSLSYFPPWAFGGETSFVLTPSHLPSPLVAPLDQLTLVSIPARFWGSTTFAIHRRLWLLSSLRAVSEPALVGQHSDLFGCHLQLLPGARCLSVAAPHTPCLQAAALKHAAGHKASC